MTYPRVLDAAYSVADVADVTAGDEGVGLEADHDPALAVHHTTLVDQAAPHRADVGQDPLILGRTAHTSRCALFYWVPCMYTTHCSQASHHACIQHWWTRQPRALRMWDRTPSSGDTLHTHQGVFSFTGFHV